MIHAIIKPNAYQDSVNLMLLSSKLSRMDGIKAVSIMMGTPANKELFRSGNLWTEKLTDAGPNDMCIVVDSGNAAMLATVAEEVEAFLSAKKADAQKAGYPVVRSWAAAMQSLPDANIALISLPGKYAAQEADKALDNGLSVFMFSDNVDLEYEIALKKKAHEKGLLVMGPDCGTASLAGIPLAFTNVVRQGSIGLVAASGTGLQEVMVSIDRLGGGITQAFGLGGRDLSEAVGGITAQDALGALASDPATKAVVFISKPPAPSVRNKILNTLKNIGKPVVAIFMGQPAAIPVGQVRFAATLEDAARLAMDCISTLEGASITDIFPQLPVMKAAGQRHIKGLYSGGTLGAEAAMLIQSGLDIQDQSSHTEGRLLDAGGHSVIDLGDDKYTVGAPHPMIDSRTRVEMLLEAVQDPLLGIVLLDVVLGYGGNEDMAGSLTPAIEKAGALARQANRFLVFIASVCGTDGDPQGLEKQKKILRDAGVHIVETNARAVSLAVAAAQYLAAAQRSPMACSEKIASLMRAPKCINLGLRTFADTVFAHNGRVIHFDWMPPASGSATLASLLSKLQKHTGNDMGYSSINEANDAVVAKILAADCSLMDVVPAHTVIPELQPHVLLHAGPPPMTYADMTNPMQGSCIGALLFEGWAETEEEAVSLLSSGAIHFIPCHHVNAVGPMGGITSANMPVLVVKNKEHGNTAYCTMNEGIGKVLRFGAYNREVVDRLLWMKDELGPAMSKALARVSGGLALGPTVARAITMGDEFHQRNIAASALLLRDMVPYLIRASLPADQLIRVLEFLGATDQFFLNVMMAYCKAAMDAASTIQAGCIVTSMTRNGREFGIRISGMGDQWFTAPVNTPQGLYFSGFSGDDANPDIGDSAITETYGVGAMTMIAAPGVTRFVGAGGFYEALRISDELQDICTASNPALAIPCWDFKGAPVGIDIRKVVETGITPLINTGIAHKKAGVGQIGAGTVRAPLGCFEKALEAYAQKLGIA